MKIVVEFHIFLVSLATVGILGTSAFASGEFTLESARSAATNSDPQAEFFLGKYYSKPNPATRNYTTAAGYMEKAANQGYAPAQTALGSFYARGLGVDQDFSEALKWYHRAAAQGDALAEYCIGYAYSHGDGVSKDDAQTLKWWTQSAKHGQVYAQNALGQYYLHGGVPPNPKHINYSLAAKWFEKAAAQDYTPAISSLGLLYQFGEGEKKDWPQALKYYRIAANRGDAFAEGKLGLIYESGDGVPVDKVEAYKWYLLASEQGDVEGKHSVMWYNMGHYLTPEETAKAKALAAQFQAHIQTNQTASAQSSLSQSHN